MAPLGINSFLFFTYPLRPSYLLAKESSSTHFLKDIVPSCPQRLKEEMFINETKIENSLPEAFGEFF